MDVVDYKVYSVYYLLHFSLEQQSQAFGMIG